MGDESGTSIAIEHAAEELAPGGELAKAPQPSKLGWIAAAARHVGGACLDVLASPAVGTLIFASVCLALSYQHRKRRSSAQPPPPPREVPRLNRSISMAMLHGGENAMKRLTAALETRVDGSKLRKAVDDMRQELAKAEELADQKVDFSKLYVSASMLEMSGKEDEAIEMLEKTLNTIKGQKGNRHTNMAHELELLLVEMLIYKEDHAKALNYTCLCSKDISEMDARVPLYLAIIYTMKDDMKQAEENYDKFTKIRREFYSTKFYKDRSALVHDVADFHQFKTIVHGLKAKIEDSQAHTKTVSNNAGGKNQTAQRTNTNVDRGKSQPAQGGTQNANKANELKQTA